MTRVIDFINRKLIYISIFNVNLAFITWKIQKPILLWIITKIKTEAI